MNDHALSPPPVASSHSSWAGSIHLLAILASWCTVWMVGFGGMAVGLTMWLVQENKQGIVAQNAAEVFNQNLTLFIYAAALVVLTVVTLFIGLIVTIPAAILLALAWFVVALNSARHGFNGNVYRAPFVIRLIG